MEFCFLGSFKLPVSETVLASLRTLGDVLQVIHIVQRRSYLLCTLTIFSNNNSKSLWVFYKIFSCSVNCEQDSNWSHMCCC